MRLENLTKSKYFWLGLFAFFFLLTRLPGIPGDIINPDGANWHTRAEQFVVGLKYFQLERTYQHYQPGVTLMWIVGPTVEIVKQLSGLEIYDQNSFLTFHFYSRLVLILIQLGLTFIGVSLLTRILYFKKALLAFTLFTFEPFFIANSRVLHLDILLTLLLFNGLLLSFIYIKEKNWKHAVLAGVFLSLATLTKSVAIGGVFFASGMLVLHYAHEKNIKEGIKSGLLIFIPALLTFFILLPALWVDAKNVLWLMYDGIERVGIRKGHNQVLFGEDTREASAVFYPLVFLVKTSPFFLALSALSLRKVKLPKFSTPSIATFLTIFFVGYLVVMTISTKKIDRYILPIYPYVSLLIILSLSQFENIFKKLWVKMTLGLGILFFIIFPLFQMFPHYFTYTNPLFGSPQFVHENILAQKPFGVGIPELKELILERYGDYPSVGFIDKKPMAEIYRGSRIFDLRVDGVRRFDLMILGVNEEIPEEVLKSETNFVKDYSMYINGLEYWKIYVKEN